MRRAPKNSGAKRQTHKRTIDGVEEGPGGDFLSLFLRTKKPHESEWKTQGVRYVCGVKQFEDFSNFFDTADRTEKQKLRVNGVGANKVAPMLLA